MVIVLEKIINFRSLAKDKLNKNGKRIIPNTIFRSGILTFASKKDLQKLKELNIKYIYDFRSSDERQQLEELNQNDFNIRHFDILKGTLTNQRTFKNLKTDAMLDEMLTLYGESLPKSLEYKKVIQEILKQETKEFVFHCSSGKDRTGVFGIILMLILDFNIQTIKEEYLTIEASSIEFMRHHFMTIFNVDNPKELDPLITVFEEYFDIFIKVINKKYGSTDNYLLKLGVSKEVKEKLIKIYCDL